MDSETLAAPVAILVPESERLDFLPRYLGRHFLLGEQLVFAWAKKLIEGYSGGYWHFYDVSGTDGELRRAFYVAPNCAEPVQVSCAGNFYSGEMSADAAGVVVTLFALNNLICKVPEDALIECYYALRDYAGEHAESAAIFAAID